MCIQKKIILFSLHLDTSGGAERLLLEHAKFLRNKNYIVHIFSFNFKETVLFNNTYENKNIHQIGKNYEDSSFNLFARLIRIYQLRKKIKEIKPNLIIGQYYIDCSILYLATLFSKYNYVSYIHGTMMWFIGDLKYSLIFKKSFLKLRKKIVGHKTFNAKKHQYNNIVRWAKNNIWAILNYLAVRHAKALFSLTNVMADEVKELYNTTAFVNKGAYNDNIFNYVPKISIREDLNLNNKNIILNINRLDKRKRIDLLLEAFNIFLKDNADSVLVIGGTGEEAENLKNLALKLGIEKKVIFLGFLEERKLLDYCASCDLFVHPNWAEYVISVYEALAMGSKVLCTIEMDFDKELLDYGQIYLSEVNAQTLASNMNKALANSSFEKIPVDLLKKYTWNNYFNNIHSKIKPFSDIAIR